MQGCMRRQSQLQKELLTFVKALLYGLCLPFVQTLLVSYLHRSTGYIYSFLSIS